MTFIFHAPHALQRDGLVERLEAEVPKSLRASSTGGWTETSAGRDLHCGHARGNVSIDACLTVTRARSTLPFSASQRSMRYA